MSAVTSQRRRRQACERCWKRKQKCDRLYPVCTACTGLDVECRERQFGIDASTTEEIGVTHASVIRYVCESYTVARTVQYASRDV